MFLTVLAAAMAILSRTSLRFGWEEVSFEEMHDDAFVHQNLTNRAYREYAAGQPGFEASLSLEWQTDYIDSYLYNPLFWATGLGSGSGLDRLKVGTALTHELESLHFDDLSNADQIATMWTRYLSGCVAGLYWASENNDVAAAHNILGATFHAIQDFYSHSNWVDSPDRRSVPWPTASPGVRGGLPLYSGSYETAEHLSQKPHGRVSLECSLMQSTGVGPLVDLACGPLSPLYRQSPCQVHERCGDAQTVRTSVLGVQLPGGLVYLDPPGIALDSSWQAEIARQLRDIAADDDIAARDLFERAKDLAVASTVWWLRALEAQMGRDPETAAFWQRVVKTDQFEHRYAQFEDFSRLPFLFVGHGEYPPSGRGSDWDWYLRLQIRTSSETDAGTNGSVKVHAEGKAFLLDYGKNSNAVVEYNDFSTGDVQSYVVGPFANLPAALTFEVEGNDVGDILNVIWEGFVGAVGSVVDLAGDLLLTLIGGHADHVATTKLMWGPEELASVGTEPQPFTVFLDGDDEGQYHVYGSIRSEIDDSVPHRHRRFVVRIDELECWEESFLHPGEGESEEPFLLAALVNLSEPDPEQRVDARRTQPFSDVDRRERVAVGMEFRTVVPDGVGMLALPLSVWESDHETAAERDRILGEFAGRTETETRSWSDRLIETIGATFGSDWKLGGLRAFAFTRAPFGSRAGTVHPSPGGAESIERWVDAGSTLKIQLAEPAQWHTWELPREAVTSTDFSFRAASAFDAGDLAASENLVAAGVEELRPVWQTHPEVPADVVLSAAEDWTQRSSQHHPIDVSRQTSAARNGWALASMIGRHRLAQPAPPQDELMRLSGVLDRLVGLLTWGTPDSAPAVAASGLLRDVYWRLDGDHRADVANAWTKLSVRHHETAFQRAVADQQLELLRQRDAAAEALAIFRVFVDEPDFPALPQPTLSAAASSLRWLVGTASFGVADAAASIEANDLAQRVWPLIHGDRRVEAAETWTGLALRRHEISFHPDCVDPSAEQAGQREAAAQAMAILRPVVDALPSPAISDTQLLLGAASLRRLIGLSTYGAPDSAASITANAWAQRMWTLAPGDHHIERAGTWTDLAMRRHEISFHPACPDPAVEQAGQREAAAEAARILLDIDESHLSETPELVTRLAAELQRVRDHLISGLADLDPNAAALRTLQRQVDERLETLARA